MKTWIACLAVLLLLAANRCEAQGLKLTLNPVPTIYTGTQYTFRLVFAKQNLSDGIEATGPFQARIHLPDGVGFRSTSLGQLWSCTGAQGAQDVECIYSGELVTHQSSNPLQIEADVSPNATPGPATITVTLESPQYPLSDPPVCAPTPSSTGCTTATTAIVASTINVYRWLSSGGSYGGAVVTWTGQPWEAGASRQLRIQMQDIGYGLSNTPVTVRIALPPGVSYVAGTGTGTPIFDCTAAAQIVTCTTAYLYDTQIASVWFDVALSADVAVPGPIVFHAALGNDVQQQTLANCQANPYQTGCGRLTVPTRAPQLAYLRFKPVPDDVTHSPQTFTLGQSQGTVEVNFQNIGEGNSAATTLAIQLPPGLGYAGTIDSAPSMICASSGSVSTGAILTCAGGVMPAGANGFLDFHVAVGPETEVPGPIVLVGAIDQSSPPSLDALAVCATDPDHGYCFWHEIPTAIPSPCAGRYGGDGIYCDGFENALPFQ